MSPSASSILVRLATPDDVLALVRLVRHLGFQATADQMCERFARIEARGDCTLVAERGGRVVGFTGVALWQTHVFDAPSARVMTLVVEPGGGDSETVAALVAEAERWARARGAAQLLLSAMEGDAVDQFYRGLGYERAGVRYQKNLG